jgi:hypothetical protein
MLDEALQITSVVAALDKLCKEARRDEARGRVARECFVARALVRVVLRCA